MKFGIQKKLLLLIAVLSLALIISSVLVSAQLYSASMRKSTIRLCEETAGSLSDTISAGHSSFINLYKGKLEAVYLENREDLEAVAAETFSSFEERETYYSQFTRGIFPPKNAVGLSYEMAMFNVEYGNLIDAMDMLSYAGGLDVSTVFFYDRDHCNMVSMIDRQPEGSALYNFPASVSKAQDPRLQKAIDERISVGYMDGADCYSLYPVGDGSADIYVLVGRLNAGIAQSTRLFSLYVFGILLGATLVIALFVLLFANRLIVKNIKKLTATSEKFTSEIAEDRPEKTSAGILSRDEIGELSNSFDLMQDAILRYTSSLAEKTAREEKMNAELELAARIQAEALPAGGMKVGPVTLESFLRPAREVGGDLYDHFMLDGSRLFFCLADVSGKGVPAALFMMRAKELIKSSVGEAKDLSSFAYALNNRLCAGNNESIFITAFFGVLDTASGQFSYLRAGHEQPVLRRDGGFIRLGEESNFVLGVFEDVEFTQDEIVLLPGDVLLAFTDGLSEGINANKEAFGYERIDAALLAARDGITKTMYESLSAFCGNEEQFDDVTMLALSVGKKLILEFDSPGWDDIPAAADRILGELSGCDAESAAEVGIIIDEVMNNQISYAFDGIAEPHASVSLELCGDRAVLSFEDNGREFDPLTNADGMDLSTSDGGFGIRLVKEMSDEQRYERTAGLNRLTVIKSLRKRPREEGAAEG